MASQLLFVFALCSVICSGHSYTTTLLEDVSYTVYAQDLLGKAHSIPKGWFDTLIECYVVFPNGVVYQAYPSNNLPADGNVSYLEAAAPFNSCGVQVRPIGLEHAGTYELYSFVHEMALGDITLTRQKFSLDVREVDWRANEPDQ